MTAPIHIGPEGQNGARWARGRQGRPWSDSEVVFWGGPCAWLQRGRWSRVNDLAQAGLCAPLLPLYPLCPLPTTTAAPAPGALTNEVKRVSENCPPLSPTGMGGYGSSLFPEGEGKAGSSPPCLWLLYPGWGMDRREVRAHRHHQGQPSSLSTSPECSLESSTAHFPGESGPGPKAQGGPPWGGPSDGEPPGHRQRLVIATGLRVQVTGRG